MQQLVLPLQLDGGASFENYFSGPNGEAVAALQSLLAKGGRRRVVYLWGAAGCGRSHLLHALCRRAGERGRLHLYLPLADAASFSPPVIEHLNPASVVCLDDLQAVAGLPEWEESLFSLFEKISHGPGALAVTADAPPAALELGLPDLASRLAAASVYRLLPLDDRGRGEFLRLRARERGLELGDEVVKYILCHSRRDTASLFSLLDRIDAASLSEGRRITVPFIRHYFEEQGGGGW